jgi:hypothetical protein
VDNTVTAVIMLGTGGISEFEELVHSSRRRAAIATAQTLATLHQIDKIILAAPKSERVHWEAHPDFGLLSDRLQWDFDSPEVEFHFGKRIGELVLRLALERLLYIGAGSMPLLSHNQMTEVVGQLSRAGKRWAITNNLHSSDWLGITDATVLPEAAAHLPRDNMLGWVLKNKAGFRLRALPPSAATQLDIDTPTDLVALRWHPGTNAQLRSFVAERLPSDPLARWKASARFLITPGSQIALIGRVSPHTWQVLQSHTEVWIRVFSEEQGMTASGRWGGGHVRSLLAHFMDRSGPKAVFDQLSEMVDAAFIDTRVFLAHHGRWPSASDRFASDMCHPEAINDARLRDFTEAAMSCRSPMVLGAFGAVSGGLYALVETLQAGKDWLSDAT